MCDEPSVMCRCAFRVVENVDGRRDGRKSAGTVGRTGNGVGEFDAHSVLGNGHGGRRKLVVVEGGTVNGAPLVCDKGPY
jgi:hypothetical protein